MVMKWTEHSIMVNLSKLCRIFILFVVLINFFIKGRTIEKGYINEPISNLSNSKTLLSTFYIFFLRISDRMFEVLYQNIEQLDLNTKKNITAKTNLISYLDFLEEIKIKCQDSWKKMHLNSEILMVTKKLKFLIISILKDFSQP